MGDSNNIDVKITAKSDDKGLLEFLSKLDNVKVQLQGAGKSAQESSFGFDKLKDGLKDLALQLGALVGLGAAFNFLREGAMDAMQEASLLQQTAENMKALTGATQDQVDTLDGYTTALQMSSGVLQDQLYPALTKLGATTKDFALSQTLIEVAAGAAARGIGTFEGNVDGLIKALEGKGVRGTDAFATALRDLVKEGQLNEEQLKTLIQKYGDAGAAVDTEAMRLQRAKVAWGESKEAIGSVAAVVMDALGPALKVGATAIGMIVSGVIKMGGAFKAAGYGVLALLSATKELATGDVAGAKAAIKQYDDLARAANAAASEAADELLTSITTAFDKAPEAAKKSKKELEREAKAMQKIITSNMNTTKKAEEKITRDVLHESKDRMKQAEKERKWRILQEEIFARNHKRIMKDLAAFDDEMSDNYSQGLQDETDKLNQAELDKQATKEMAFEAAFRLGDAAFKQNKAWAYAQDIAQTYLAATTAIAPPPVGYGPTPPGYAAMALAIATGLANAVQISSAAGGYDIPGDVNPLVQAHAKEMVLPAKYADMFRAMADRTPSVITNNHQTINDKRHGGSIVVNQQLLTGAHADYAFRELDRRLRPARRMNDRYMSNPATVKIGSKRKAR